LPVDVKMVGKVGHGNKPRPFAIKLPCGLHWVCDAGNTSA
jgi:hypothetical protein